MHTMKTLGLAFLMALMIVSRSSAGPTTGQMYQVPEGKVIRDIIKCDW